MPNGVSDFERQVENNNFEHQAKDNGSKCKTEKMALNIKLRKQI